MSTDDGAAYSSDQRGKKVSVSQMPDESAEAFAGRAMAMLIETESHWVLNMALGSTSGDWESVPSQRWMEARNRTDHRLWLRLTTLRADAGGAIGHLGVDWNGYQLADAWGDLREGSVYLPRTDTGAITTGWAVMWRLVHDIKGLGDRYDSAFERSGLLVE